VPDPRIMSSIRKLLGAGCWVLAHSSELKAYGLRLQA
jgi:hypothetical protein